MEFSSRSIFDLKGERKKKETEVKSHIFCKVVFLSSSFFFLKSNLIQIAILEISCIPTYFCCWFWLKYHKVYWSSNHPSIESSKLSYFTIFFNFVWKPRVVDCMLHWCEQSRTSIKFKSAKYSDCSSRQQEGNFTNFFCLSCFYTIKTFFFNLLHDIILSEKRSWNSKYFKEFVIQCSKSKVS